MAKMKVTGIVKSSSIKYWTGQYQLLRHCILDMSSCSCLTTLPAIQYMLMMPFALKKLNKGEGGQKPFLRDGWFKDSDTTCIQPMWYSRQDPCHRSSHSGYRKESSGCWRSENSGQDLN